MTRSALLFVAASLAIASSAGFYFAQPNRMALRVKELEGELSRVRSENARLRSEYEKLQAVKKAELQQAPTAAATGAQVTLPATATVAADSKDGKVLDVIPPLTKERMREMMLQTTQNRMDINYGKLFKQLGVNAEETERFKQLLVDRQTKQSDITMEISAPNLTKEQKKAISDRLSAARKESDAAIQHFLNNEEDYQAFKSWEETGLERLQVQMAVTSFDAADASLSSEQRVQLFDVLVAARKAAIEGYRLNPKTDDKAAILDRIRASDEARDQSILQQAASFMTPEQLGILEKTQQMRREMSRPPSTAPGK